MNTNADREVVRRELANILPPEVVATLDSASPARDFHNALVAHTGPTVPRTFWRTLTDLRVGTRWASGRDLGRVAEWLMNQRQSRQRSQLPVPPALLGRARH